MEENPEAREDIEVLPGSQENAGDLVVVTTIIESMDEDSTTHPEVGKESAIDAIPEVQSSSHVLIGTESKEVLLDNVQKNINASQKDIDKLPKDRSTPYIDIDIPQSIPKSLKEIEQPLKQYKSPLKGFDKSQKHGQSPFKDIEQSPPKLSSNSIEQPENQCKSPLIHIEQAHLSMSLLNDADSSQECNSLSAEREFQKGTGSIDKDIDSVRLLSQTPVNFPEKAQKETVTRCDDNSINVFENEADDSVESMNVDYIKDTTSESEISESIERNEKEHNKSISRELKSLIASAKESKIISECTQLKSKIRKSRALDSSNNSSSNTSLDVIHITRRNSTNSVVSNSSDKSERATKRSMRSQNPEFVSKHKQFLNAVTGKNNLDLDSGDEAKQKPDDTLSKTSRKRRFNASTPNKAPSPEYMNKYLKSRSDPYCWRCHWSIEPESYEKAPAHCATCPRSFHFKCLSTQERAKLSPESTWSCVECVTILNMENEDRPKRKYTVDMLRELLEYARTRMCHIKGVEPFMSPVDLNTFPDYEKYVVHPMDLSLIKNNIAAGIYKSTEAFVSDIQWILHNSIIFNTLRSKLTGLARVMMRLCRAEVSEIETCPECYAAAHARPYSWFTDVCSEPHMLLWAKLKGFPYWPAKGISLNSNGLVDVRFFGAHDRSWVPPRDCYLYSLEDPNGFRTKRQDILESMEEADQYIENITIKFGSFVHAPFKTNFVPTKLNEQLHLMIPGFQGEISFAKDFNDKLNVTASPSNAKTYRRSNSLLKSPKPSIISGDPSDEDDKIPASKIRKTDNATIKHAVTNSRTSVRAKSVGESDELQVVKDKCRKRRKSMHIEAVTDTGKQTYKRAEFNIIDDNVNTTTLKQQRIANVDEKLKSKLQEIPKLIIKKSYIKTSTPNNKVKDSVVTLNSQSREESPIPKSVNTYIDKVISESTLDADKSINKDKSVSKSSKENTEKDIHKSKDITKDKSTQQTIKLQRRRSYKNHKPVPNTVTSDKESTGNKSQNFKKSDIVSKEVDILDKVKETNKSATEKVSPLKSRSSKEQIVFDDDTSLAVLAQQVNNSIAPVPGFPTISNIRSLSDASASSSKSNSPGVDAPVAVTVKPNSVSNAKESTSKTKKATDQPVRRLEVRSFAKMTSPPPENRSTSQPDSNSVQIEIKAEPVDYDDTERQTEKLDLMNSVNLRPVQRMYLDGNMRPQHTDMTVNKVVAGAGMRQVTKPVETKPKAKKTFPQPKKVDDSKSDLNSKNTMVYIPIQPPVSQAPACPASRAPACPASRAPLLSAPAAPHLTMQRSTRPVGTICSTSMSLAGGSVAPMSLAPPAPTALAAPTVPTTVHTLPLITTVNGQWTLSLQPMMSVGNLDANTLPLVNGITTSQQPNNPTVGAPHHPHTIIANQPANLPDSNPQYIEPPRPVQRVLQNPLDPTTPTNEVPTPSSAGQTTAKLNQNAVKLTDFFRSLLEDSIEKTDTSGAQLTQLKLQLEHVRWRSQQEIEELKHNNELMMMELRTSVEKERMRIVAETRRACQLELEAAVNFAKSKQWCAICRQEAQFYCCWNTSYCNYTCQRAHWTQHFAVCTQQRPQDGSNDRRINPLDNRLQPLEVAPRTVTSSVVTVGGKSVTSKVAKLPQSAAKRPQSAPKPSLIVSMVEDASGTSTVKCLGSFKPNSMPSTLLNNQIKNTEENAKKVMTTSGGYLIVGTSSPSNTNLLLQ